MAQFRARDLTAAIYPQCNAFIYIITMTKKGLDKSSAALLEDLCSTRILAQMKMRNDWREALDCK